MTKTDGNNRGDFDKAADTVAMPTSETSSVQNSQLAYPCEQRQQTKQN